MRQLIPTRVQWQRWSKPSRASWIGAAVGVAGFTLAITAMGLAIALHVWSRAPIVSANDFHLVLEVIAHGNALGVNYVPPERIRVDAIVGPVKLTSLMELREIAREYPGGRWFGRGWRYVDKSPYVAGLDQVRLLADFIGEEISARVPARAFKFRNEWSHLVTYRLNISLAGREIVGEADKDGWVKLVIAREHVLTR